MIGWQLGVIESISVTILVGLSVDYIVHLAVGYVESRHSKRHARTRESLFLG